MTDDILWKERLILTASCFMSLYASGQIENILASLPTFSVCDGRASANEHYCINAGSDEDVTQKKEVIDIQPLVEKKLLQIVSMDYSAAATIASMGMIDDSEAIAGAMALQHDWTLVTDDSYAIDLFTRQIPEIACVSTIDIFKYWVDIRCPPSHVVEKAVRNMHKRALYKPCISHRWYPWWSMWQR